MLYFNYIKGGEPMLQYKRRNSIEKSTLQQSNKPMVTPLLTYCNWSYSFEYHIDLAHEAGAVQTSKT